MNTDQILDLVRRYEENRDFITNEETVKMALVVPFIRMLGYDPNSPREVRLEYSAEFTQGDGKRFADRMDFAIFDKTGNKPLIVIETKPLKTDLRSKCQQLARYIAQMPELHFGIITDGCHYLLFGDLENQNQMDSEPFFSFSLDDPKLDWPKVAKFLSKFSRDSFNADTLLTDAENSRYRQAMIDRLTTALRAPGENESFMRWLTEDVYKGKRTAGVMDRLGEVAKEAIEPALLRVMGDDFVNKLKARIQQLNAGDDEDQLVEGDRGPAGASPDAASSLDEPALNKKGIETTEEELEFYAVVREICGKHGIPEDEIIHRDTVNYFNVSRGRPTKWFVRFFSGGRRKSIVTLVPVEEAIPLVHGFQLEEAPATFGVSRVYIESVAQLWALKDLILRSVEVLASGTAHETSVVDDPAA